MTGKWRVRDADWPDPAQRLAGDPPRGPVVAQINGPVLELMTASRARFDRRLAELGPDILAPELDEAAFLRRLREDDPTRPIGDALLDQRVIAGIGNLWKAEGCFEAGIDPWRRTGDVSDDEALAIVRATRPRMQESARDGMQERFKVVYGTAGRTVPALRRGVEHPRARAGRRQPDDILVPTMPALRRIGHKGADLIVPGNTPASFDAALAHGVDMIEFDVLPSTRAGCCSRTTTSTWTARRRSRRASPTSPRARSTASSSTSTSSCPATRNAPCDALREHGLVERSLVVLELDALAGHDPGDRAAAAARLVGPASDATTRRPRG